MKLRPIELFLIETILFLLLWLWNDYLAMLLSLIFGSICFFVLVIALGAELIERSKVPRWYYYIMLASIAAPLVSALIYVGIVGGEMNWMKVF